MSDEQPEDPSARKEILVTYHGEAGKIPISPINGAFGGVDPHGEIIIANFFLEQQTNPVAGFIAIEEDGSVNPAEEKFQKRSDIQRTFVATFTMTPETARRIADWLIDKAQIIEQRRGNAS